MSREKILSAVKNNRPMEVALPEIPDFHPEAGDKLKMFMESVKSAAGEVIRVSGENEIDAVLKQHYPSKVKIAGVLKNVTSSIDLSGIKKPVDLENVDVAVIRARLGVAENGAVWINGEDIVHRVLPFIAQHLVVVLRSDLICWNMHEAYQEITGSLGGFGVFIAGPSKTADIEQALVIGAQGPRSYSVILD
jgi:L-lactate dehydrogenase complex protein LldG